MLQLLKQRNFFIFWLGEIISVVGDHISLIAFPWLVLQMTGSPMMMGLVLAAQGLPKAALMLFGGVFVDRSSPRKVMLLADIVRFFVMLGLGLMIGAGTQTMPLIFLAAFIFGVADAFFYPATTSILPSLVKKDELQKANAIIQMTTHTAIILGPIIAGLLIVGSFALPDTSAAALAQIPSLHDNDNTGLARAFIVDAWTFGVSILTLLLIKVRPLHEDKDETATSMWSEIKEALQFVWSIPAMRLIFFVIAILEFFFQAPIFVGLPVLAKARFVDGALIYGMILGSYGLGALIGSGVSGTVKQFAPNTIARRLCLVFAWSGMTLGLIVLFPAYQIAMLLFFTAGFGDNFIWVQFSTWLQQTTPEHLLGRVMSVLIFLAIGMLPIANMIMGALFELNLYATLITCSIIMTVVCLFAAFHKDVHLVNPLGGKTKAG